MTELDHVDRCRDNNTIENLREVTHQQNGFNLPIMSHNKSGTSGVCFDKWGHRWRAYHHSLKRRVYIGSSSTKEAAVLARQNYETGLKLLYHKLPELILKERE